MSTWDGGPWVETCDCAIKSSKKISRWWFVFFIFTPIPGEDEPILTSIFFRWVGSTTNQIDTLENFGKLLKTDRVRRKFHLPSTLWSKYMAQSPKGRLIQGLYKRIHGNCAIYFYPGVSIFKWYMIYVLVFCSNWTVWFQLMFYFKSLAFF